MNGKVTGALTPYFPVLPKSTYSAPSIIHHNLWLLGGVCITRFPTIKKGSHVERPIENPKFLGSREFHVFLKRA